MGSVLQSIAHGDFLLNLSADPCAEARALRKLNRRSLAKTCQCCESAGLPDSLRTNFSSVLRRSQQDLRYLHTLHNMHAWTSICAGKYPPGFVLLSCETSVWNSERTKCFAVSCAFGDFLGVNSEAKFVGILKSGAFAHISGTTGGRNSRAISRTRAQFQNTSIARKETNKQKTHTHSAKHMDFNSSSGHFVANCSGFSPNDSFSDCSAFSCCLGSLGEHIKS